MRGVGTQGRVVALGRTLMGKAKGEVGVILLGRVSRGSAGEQRSNL